MAQLVKRSEWLASTCAGIRDGDTQGRQASRSQSPKRKFRRLVGDQQRPPCRALLYSWQTIAWEDAGEKFWRSKPRHAARGTGSYRSPSNPLLAASGIGEFFFQSHLDFLVSVLFILREDSLVVAYLFPIVSAVSSDICGAGGQSFAAAPAKMSSGDGANSRRAASGDAEAELHFDFLTSLQSCTVLPCCP